MKTGSRDLKKFDRWVKGQCGVLSRDGSIDIHADELIPERSKKEWVRALVELYAEIIRARGSRLSGMVLMLIIPLPATKSAVRTAPAWSTVENSNASTPPSLYLMHRRVRDMPWRAERFVTPLEVPPGLETTPLLVSWRRPEDPEEEGWEQDVRVEHSFK